MLKFNFMYYFFTLLWYDYYSVTDIYDIILYKI